MQKADILNTVRGIGAGLAAICLALSSRSASPQESGTSLWDLARSKSDVHRFSTLFTAQDVRGSLGTQPGLEQAIQWCKQTGVTKVYLEVFRDGYRAERQTVLAARDRFRGEGFLVHGCVTPTGVGKRSTGWRTISCYTSQQTQEEIESIFRYAAGVADVVMIDDFWFTDCQCDECTAAKGEQSWAEYRMALMQRVSRQRVIAPAREVNPQVQLIIKYPEWYEQFHERGYDIEHQPTLFDITWIGTETRDPDNPRWGKKPQYGAYWIAQWAAAASGGKLGGGWFDPLGTTRHTYVEQARQTVLGQCRESMLFCYGALGRDSGPDDVQALRGEIAGLLQLAELVKGEPARGVGTYKPPHSPPGQDAYAFNFLGMLGIPMTAGIQFPTGAPALLLTEHAAADPSLPTALAGAIEAGTPVLITSGLRRRLAPEVQSRLSAPQVQVVEVDGSRARSFYGVSDALRELLELPRDKVDALRRPLLAPLGLELSAPTLVSLHLFGDRKVVLENFRDEPVEVRLSLRQTATVTPVLSLPPGAEIETNSHGVILRMPARSMAALIIER